MNIGEVRLRYIYNYLADMEGQARDASHSPFLTDIAEECKWWVEYYETGKDFVEDFWKENWVTPCA